MIFGITTDVPFILNNVSFNIDYQGTFDTRRSIVWQLDLLAKAWLYSNVREQTRIKETIVQMEDKDFSAVYETLISYVDPRSAEKDDPHTIVDKIYMGKSPLKLGFDFTTGETLVIGNPELEEDQYVNLDIMPFITGEYCRLIEF